MKTYNVTYMATFTVPVDADSSDDAKTLVLSKLEAISDQAKILDCVQVLPCLGCGALVPAPTEQVLNSGVCDRCTSKAFAEAG